MDQLNEDGLRFKQTEEKRYEDEDAEEKDEFNMSQISEPSTPREDVDDHGHDLSENVTGEDPDTPPNSLISSPDSSAHSSPVSSPEMSPFSSPEQSLQNRSRSAHSSDSDWVNIHDIESDGENEEQTIE